MEEGGAHQSSYITWLLHHLVAVLCNDANGEQEGGKKLDSKSARSQVSCCCRGSQCTSLLLPYERPSVRFTPKRWRFSSRPDRREAAAKLPRPQQDGCCGCCPVFRNPERTVSGVGLQRQAGTPQVSLFPSATLGAFPSSNQSGSFILWPLPSAPCLPLPHSSLIA